MSFQWTNLAFCTLSTFLLVGGHLAADETQTLTDETVLEASSDDAFKMRINAADCRRLVRHQASAGVAYTPGVDVRGNPVSPADATGTFTLPLPDVYEFVVSKDLAGYLGKSDEQLAAEEAAAIAAARNKSATDAAASSASMSLSGAQSVFDTASAALTAVETAAAAAPNDEALAAAMIQAQGNVNSAQTGLTATQVAVDATRNAALANDVTAALAASQSALNAAQEIGYAPNAAAVEARNTALSSASEYATASASAGAAMETVAKSSTMTLNIGTVRYNINTGSMTFNGEPLVGEAEAAIAAQCQQMMVQ